MVLFACGIINLNCGNHPDKNQKLVNSDSLNVLEKAKVISIAEDIAIKKYGAIIKGELPLKAQLIGDSIWIVEGSLPKGSDGGTVYIELRRSDHKIVRITHSK
ncbi:hypothetical protein A8C56_21330 [Niabella ginsenosidivorans]|uniref:NTF2 fold domain-containing protein n=2 Tax=Niabella ginsenosidivorans TaxID=1176587 RepID=A0A1A9I6I4_9BACT|nr:hypothetical protein A8C56_21330 [Niabella ginsenosidivorans]